MPFPDGMLTRVVSFPTFVDLEGLVVKCTIRVYASRPLIWAATGQTVLRDAEIVVTDTAVQMTLPTTDQTGITDGAGNTVEDWTYTASYQLAKGGSIPDTTFDLPLGPGTPVTINRDVSGLVSGGVVNVPTPVAGPAGPPGVVQSIVAGANVTVNSADPANPIVSATGGGGGGAAAWGSITGTLSAQTDLQTALNGKQPAGSYAAAVHTHAQSDVTNLTTDLAAKADLASPTFTGDPKAPTPATADNDTSIATTAFVKAQGYAPLASPALTGNPTAPTPTAGDNDTSIATTAFVATSFAPLASPALTGNPTAPTPTAGDNDTSIATTAFVTAAKVDATVAEFIRDTIGTTLVAGTNVTISVNDVGDTITINASGGGGSGPDLFPRKSGQYYTTTHPLQATNTDANVFGTSGQRVFLIPFSVTHAQTIDRLAINVATAGGAGSLLRLGIYPHDSAWGTVSKTVSASVAADTTGDKNATISQALVVGQYWLAVGTTDTGGALIVRRGNANSSIGGPFGGGSPAFVAGEWALQYNGISLASDLPATINLGSPSSAVANDVPLVWARKA